MALSPGMLSRAASAARDIINEPRTAIGALTEEVRGTRDVIESAVIRRGAAPARAIEYTQGKEAATRFDVVQAANTEAAATHLVQRAIDTGILPGDDGLRMASLNDTARVLNEMDDITRADALTVLNTRSNLQAVRRDKTADKSQVPVWEATIARGEANKGIRTVMAMMEDIRVGTLHYLHKEGMISDSEAIDLIKEVGYLPRTPKGDDPKTLLEYVTEGAFINPHSKKEMLQPSLKQRTAEKERATMEYDERDPIGRMVQYVEDSIRYTGENKARKEFIDTMLQGDKQRGIVKRLGKGEKTATGNEVYIKRNGAVERYEVGDKRVYNALKYDARAIFPVANEMRKWYQWVTTGIFAPQFAVTSLKYDAGFGLLGMRTREMVSGPIDAALKTSGRSETFRDVVAPLVRIAEMPGAIKEGITQAAIGRKTEEGVRTAIRYATDAGLYDPQTPPAIKKQIAADLSKVYRAYSDTVYNHLVASGYTPNIVSDDLVQVGLLERTIKGTLEKHKTGRFYLGALDTVKDAYRMAAFSRNVAFEEAQLRAKTGDPNAKLTKKDYDRIAYHVRIMASDPTAQGGNPAVTWATSTSPYANIILQSTWHLARQMNNPAAYSTIVWGSMAALGLRYLISSNMEQGEYERIRSETPIYQRVTGLMFPTPEAIKRAAEPGGLVEPWTEDDVTYLGLGPELGFLISLGADTTETFYDAYMGSQTDVAENNLARRSGEASLNLLNFATPPIVNWGAAIAGKGQIDYARSFFSDREAEQQAMRGSNEMLPDYRAHGLSSGWVGEREAALIRMATGVNAATITDLVETTLDAEYNDMDEVSFQEGARNAMGTVLHNLKARNPIATTLFPDAVVQRDSRGTSLSQRFYEIKHALTQLVDQERIIRGDGVLGNISDPIHVPEGSMLIPRLSNENGLRDQLMDVIQYFKNDYREVQLDEISKLERKSGLVRGNVHVSKNAANALYNDYVGAISDRQRLVLQDYSVFEERMREQYANPEWTLMEFTEAVKKDLRWSTEE